MVQVQGMIEIDNKKMTDEEHEEFNKFLSNYFIDYKKLSVINGREYDSVILRDVNLLYDSEYEEIIKATYDEEGNKLTEETTETKKKHGILTIMKDRNVVINGMWDQQGIPYGQAVITDIIGEETLQRFIGEPLYKFDLAMHLKHTPDEISGENGEIKTKVTWFKPLHSFSGWGTITEY